MTYVSTLSTLEELICNLECDCIKNLIVYEELTTNKKYSTAITTTDTIVPLNYGKVEMSVSFYLSQKQWKQIGDIITCLACVKNLYTTNYIYHKVQIDTEVIAIDLLQNNVKVYNGIITFQITKR